MQLKLKRIKSDLYDELIKNIDYKNFFDKSQNEIYKNIEKYSEDLLIDGKEVIIEIDPDNYLSVVKNHKKGDSSIKIAEMLHRDFIYNGKHIPLGIMLEKELWTYLNMTIFFDVTMEKYCYDRLTKDMSGKIERTFFNKDSKVDRTGLRYLWILADATEYEGNYELTEIAWKFIDTFKALHECVIGKSTFVDKAIALSFKKLNLDPRIKNENNRRLLPLHLRNFACSNMIDSYDDVENLAGILANQISAIMNNNKIQEAKTAELKKKAQEKKMKNASKKKKK